MAFDLSHMPYILDMVGMHKKKQAWTNAQLVADINTFASRNWSENYLESLLAGTLKLSHADDDVFREYLIFKFYEYNCTA